jgi:hypothetical protein
MHFDRSAPDLKRPVMHADLAVVWVDVADFLRGTQFLPGHLADGESDHEHTLLALDRN